MLEYFHDIIISTDGAEERLMHASHFRSNKAFSQTFTLVTVRNEEFTFQSPNAEDIRDLVRMQRATEKYLSSTKNICRLSTSWRV